VTADFIDVKIVHKSPEVIARIAHRVCKISDFLTLGCSCVGNGAK